MKKETLIQTIAIVVLVVSLGTLLYFGLNSTTNNSNNESGPQGEMQGGPRNGK